VTCYDLDVMAILERELDRERWHAVSEAPKQEDWYFVWIAGEHAGYPSLEYFGDGRWITNRTITHWKYAEDPEGV
jgi:hypothetical protein